jgi:hypothetical protein
LSLLGIRHAIESGAYGQVLADQIATRARLAIQRFKGGGREERSYTDWVLHRFGPETYKRLHKPYAQRRWGAPEALHVSVARLHHAQAPADRVALGSSPQRGHETLCAKVGEIRLGVEPRKILVEEGTVVALETNQGRIQVNGPLLFAGIPASLMGLMEQGLPESLAHDVARLPPRHRIQVAFDFESEVDSHATHLHMIRGDAPFFRLDQVGAIPGTQAQITLWQAQISVPPSDPLWRAEDRDLGELIGRCLPALGLPKMRSGPPRVERLRHHDPGWVGPWGPVHGRLAERFCGMGIVLVGRPGAHRFMDPGQELAVAAALGQGAFADMHEALRRYGDPPVSQQDENQRLDPFVMG